MTTDAIVVIRQDEANESDFATLTGLRDGPWGLSVAEKIAINHALREITRLRAENAELSKERDELTAECRLRAEQCRLYHNTVEAANSIINELSAKIAAHEKVCAGT